MYIFPDAFFNLEDAHIVISNKYKFWQFRLVSMLALKVR
jgi:hypothetical protein